MRTDVVSKGSTQHRILAEASKLFATRGFLGTSTRDIAHVVGIRQPSLFHHFPSKHAILIALLDLDLDRVDLRLRHIETAHESSAVKLHCHLALDVHHILEFPFDVRGLYVKNESVPEGPEFSIQRRKLSSVHRRVRQMVQHSITIGEFIDIDPEFVRQLISSAIVGVMWSRGPSPSKGLSKRAHEVPDFILRSLLTDAGDLQEITGRSLVLQSEVKTTLSSLS